MKKVVLLSGALKPSGSTTWIMNLHRGLIEAGAEVVHLVTSEPTDIAPGFGRVVYTGRARSGHAIRLMRWGQLHKLLPAWYRTQEDHEYGRRVCRILAELGWDGKVDLVVKDFTSYMPEGLATYPVVAVIHQVLSNSRGRRLGDAARQGARFFVPVSRVAGNDAMARGLDVTDPICNPIDIERVRVHADAFVPPFDRPYLVFVGRLVSGKRVRELLSAYARISSDIDLVYVGQGEELDELKSMAERMGLAHRVHFTGFQPNPYPFMKHAKLLVLPSRSEAMPYVPIEASVLGVNTLLAGFDAAHEFFEPDSIMDKCSADDFVERLADRIDAVLAGADKVGIKPGVLERMTPRAVALQYLGLLDA